VKSLKYFNSVAKVSDFSVLNSKFTRGDVIMIDLRKLDDLLAESGSKWASKNFQQNGFVYQVVNVFSTPPKKNDYEKLLDSIDLEQCIREGYFAIYHQKAKMTAGILAFIFGSEQEREDFVKNHPDSK